MATAIKAEKTPTDPEVAEVLAENAEYRDKLSAKAAVLRKDAGLQPWDDEWLSRRGNYYTMISPELAAKLLERNENNRKPKRRAIQQYARDMVEGNWNPDASDLKFDRQGRLIDGQNRCMASVEAGVPFPTLVRTGLDSDARDHVDQGVRRTAGDSFYMRQLQDPNNIAAAINMRVRYDRTVNEFGGRQAQDRRVPMTHAELIEYLETHQQFERMVPLATQMQREGPGVPRSVYLAALATFAESSEKMAREFAEKFIDGQRTGTGDPLVALDRYLARAKSPAELRTKSRNRNLQHLGAFVRVWNAFLHGDPLDRLQIKDTDLLESAI